MSLKFVYGVISYNDENGHFVLKGCRTADEYNALLMTLLFTRSVHLISTVVLTPPDPP
jgi:hypothetical protein